MIAVLHGLLKNQMALQSSSACKNATNGFKHCLHSNFFKAGPYNDCRRQWSSCKDPPPDSSDKRFNNFLTLGVWSKKLTTASESTMK